MTVLESADLKFMSEVSTFFFSPSSSSSCSNGALRLRTQLNMNALKNDNECIPNRRLPIRSNGYRKAVAENTPTATAKTRNRSIFTVIVFPAQNQNAKK